MRKQAINPARQAQAALTDAQIVRLARLGRRIEHFGRPQDIDCRMSALPHRASVPDP